MIDQPSAIAVMASRRQYRSTERLYLHVAIGLKRGDHGDCGRGLEVPRMAQSMGSKAWEELGEDCLVENRPRVRIRVALRIRGRNRGSP